MKKHASDIKEQVFPLITRRLWGAINVQEEVENKHTLHYILLIQLYLILDVVEKSTSDKPWIQCFRTYSNYMIRLVEKGEIAQLISELKDAYQTLVTSDEATYNFKGCVFFDIFERMSQEALCREQHGDVAFFRIVGSAIIYPCRATLVNSELRLKAILSYLDVDQNVSTFWQGSNNAKGLAHKDINNDVDAGLFLRFLKRTIEAWVEPRVNPTTGEITGINPFDFYPFHGSGGTYECPRGDNANDAFSKFKHIEFHPKYLYGIYKVEEAQRAFINDILDYHLGDYNGLYKIDHHIGMTSRLYLDICERNQIYKEDDQGNDRDRWKINWFFSNKLCGKSKKKTEAISKSKPNTECSGMVPLQKFMADYLETEKGCKTIYATRSRITFVPKAADKMRTVSSEPTTAMWLQQGLRRCFKRAFKKGFLRGRLDQSSQARNQEMCKQGSLNMDDNSYATIDLSAASDSVSLELVKYLFKDTWLYHPLLAFRSEVSELPDPSTLKAKKKKSLFLRASSFAAMGCAMTFSVEQLVFGACAHLASWISSYGWSNLERGYEAFAPLRWSAYGDDIIVKSKAYHLCCRILATIGFKINEDKSYTYPSPYRESCGVEARYGKDITPIKVARTLTFEWMRDFNEKTNEDISSRQRLLAFLESRETIISQLNRFYNYGCKNTRQFLLHLLMNEDCAKYCIFGINEDDPLQILSDEATNFTEQFTYDAKLQAYYVKKKRVKCSRQYTLDEQGDVNYEYYRYLFYLSMKEDDISIAERFDDFTEPLTWNKLVTPSIQTYKHYMYAELVDTAPILRKVHITGLWPIKLTIGTTYVERLILYDNLFKGSGIYISNPSA